MLQPLRLVVHLIPAVAERLDQVALQQAMVADHFQGDPFAGLGQLHAPVALVLHQPELAETLDHVGHGWRRPPRAAPQCAAR